MALCYRPPPLSGRYQNAKAPTSAIYSGDSRAQKQAIDPRASAREALEHAAQSESMTRALQTLNPEARIAVLLRFREEMSFEEMSTICGERAKTLQARVARALPKLRDALEKET